MGQFEEQWDLDFAYALPGVARFRANYLHQERGLGAVFRIIPEKIRTLEELKAPPALSQLADLEQGLVLVTGPTGSGKSTTLAAIIDQINTRHAKHIVTIEDPVEFVHPNKRCTLSQREVGHDTESFANALRSAIRQDPGVILVGEMRDMETIALAITAAEMGVLVFGTLHTNSAAKTIDRVIDAFPTDQQQQVRTMLSESLAAVVSQLLLAHRRRARAHRGPRDSLEDPGPAQRHPRGQHPDDLQHHPVGEEPGHAVHGRRALPARHQREDRPRGRLPHRRQQAALRGPLEGGVRLTRPAPAARRAPRAWP